VLEVLIRKHVPVFIQITVYNESRPTRRRAKSSGVANLGLFLIDGAPKRAAHLIRWCA